ncbi:MarR family winged helix-turn-helix transcriptional regulator [Streptosporangium lutulentum]|uniref:DNA-binding MarR family transcriptional regulator n=1 Tax=Streptosporangium lutulentum TaxID=1461250 RepID=A0ABT9QTZ2_9ACTN|nr:MarR family transcriptional regulator [Streptosporangium lutulentum]MDP9850156.1 DNA-binding MarR family transcriptional regulator [Streptosporangium lutulentum]
MNGVELFLLGRTLMKIGEEAMPTEGIGDHSTGVRTVLIVVSDLREHPDSSVGEIAKRTGLPQSAVSAAVARLREAGSVVTMTDPGDRRRLLVRRAPEVSERVAQVRSTSIEDALGASLGTDDPERIREIVDALESLARCLSPTRSTRRPG